MLRSSRALLRRPRGRFVANAGIGHLAFAGVAFLGAVISARVLGVEDKGVYTAWTLVSSTGAFVLAGGAPTGFGRAFLQGYRRGASRLALRHAALAGLILIPAIPTGLLLGFNLGPVICCVCLGVPAALVILNLSVVLQAAKRAWAYQGIRLVQAGIVTAGFVAIAVLPTQDDLLLAFSIWAVALLTSSVSAVYFVRAGEEALAEPSTADLVGTLGKGSGPARLVDWLTLRADQFVLVGIAGPAGLGVYSVAVNISEIGLYFGHSLGDAVFEDSSTLDTPSALRVLRLAGLALVVGALVLGGLGVLLIEPLFGSAFADARWLLLILLPGIVARGVGYTAIQILMARGDGAFVSRAMTRTLFAGLVLTAVATLIGGVWGTAIGASAMYSVQMLLTSRRLLEDLR